MKFYEFVRLNDLTLNVDEEYYMIKAWNGAIQACLDEIAQNVDVPEVVQSYLENLKQSEDVF